MKISYWDCNYSNYEEKWNGEEETRIYGCTHPEGDGGCLLDNKWGCDVAGCPLLDKEVDHEV